MSRKVSYMPPEKYDLVKIECSSYNVRRKIVVAGNADADLIKSARKINAAFDAALKKKGLDLYEAQVLRDDVIFNRGWCNSELAACISYESYVNHKRIFCKTVEEVMGI